MYGVRPVLVASLAWHAALLADAFLRRRCTQSKGLSGTPLSRPPGRDPRLSIPEIMSIVSIMSKRYPDKATAQGDLGQDSQDSQDGPSDTRRRMRWKPRTDLQWEEQSTGEVCAAAGTQSRFLHSRHREAGLGRSCHRRGYVTAPGSMTISCGGEVPRRRRQAAREPPATPPTAYRGR